MKPKAPRYPLLRRLTQGVLMATGTALVLGACGSRVLATLSGQQSLPEPIRVPMGNQAVLEAQGRGNLVYECQAIKRTPYEYAWLLRSSLQLKDSYGNVINYFPGPRSRWVHSDGSQVLAREFVEVSTAPQNLPLQRAKAEPSTASGVLQNISYVQNLRTQGGIVTSKPCTAAGLGMRTSVPYEADYVFWRPTS